MDKKLKLELEKFAAEIRIETIKQVAVRGFGHIGGALSVVDALAVLYGAQMKYDPKNPRWEGRDLMVMSKGHAGPSVYATLALKGFFPMEELKTLNQPGTKLPSHCDRNTTSGIDMTTGSLGQGFSTCVGMALARKLAGSASRAYLFVGDGEIDEGQCWEGALFANQQKLDNLIVFVDANGKQLDGYTKDIMDLGDIASKFASFGFHSMAVAGNDVEAIYEAIEACKAVKGRPSCIVLNTTKGSGFKEVEDIVLNHHIVLDQETAAKGVAALEKRVAEIEEELAHV